MTDRDRSWIEEHAVAFALGELDDSDEARFRTVAKDDPEFGDLADADPDAGHVPAALIARWNAAGRELSSLETSLVEAHLKWCPTCQEELRLVGAASPQGASVTPIRPWWPWFGGAVLGAAAMAAFLMLVQPQAPTLQGETLEVVTPRSVRGSGSPVVQLAPDAKAFLLAVPLPVDVEPGSTGVLVVLAPNGRRLVTTTVGTAPWQPPSTQVLVVADPQFETGEYAAQLRISGESTPRELGRFRIERPR